MAKIDTKLRETCRCRKNATGERLRARLSDLYSELATIRAEAVEIEAQAFASDDEHARFWITRSRQLASTLDHAHKFLAKARHIADEMDAMSEREEREDAVREIGAEAGYEEKVVEAWVARNWTPDRAAKFVAKQREGA